ncbi:DUF3000 domain-containing protein [Dermatophilus congolensis]|uniref:DUF3000 domain-containing protein n=1 Tax=Dermatophilus congolensis TaxID=1863 RepID=UPI0015F03847|nr:DUF3000 domain-containing protein [Dermatophilus congolensis]
MNYGTVGPPVVFVQAVGELESVRFRRHVEIEPLPAPKRIAPYAVAYAVHVWPARGGDATATGRFVLLHDPAGHEEWGGVWRVVIFAQADVEPEVAEDQLLAEATWSWLTDSLTAEGVDYQRLGGTVTRTSSRGFGALEGERASNAVEVRASWSPVDRHVAGQFRAFGDLLAYMGGCRRREMTSQCWMRSAEGS